MKKQLKVSVGQHTDKGRKPTNQDFHGVRIPEQPSLALKGVAMAMADGISSSEVSHIASSTAINNFLEDYYSTSEAWTAKRSAQQVLDSVNGWLYSQTMRGPFPHDKDRGYVCTFSALIIKNRTAHVFHVGDTRVYRLKTQGLEQLTNDHRLWATQETSYLSRALGIEGQCDFDYHAFGVKPGDVFIITTDGVYEFVGAQAIIDTIHANEADLDKAAQLIIAQAFSQGSDDNLSVQILRVDEVPEQLGADVKDSVDALPLPPALSPRITFEGYTVLRELHGNNRSRVYLVLDNTTQKKVVLKTLSTELAADAEAIERFLLEEWVARRINNSHVLKADSVEHERNYLYTVFEYIEGQTLAQWARDNPKPSLEVVRDFVEQIAKGLHAIHRMEMLHQDIRPENIMIDEEGTLKIIDFGAVYVAGLEETKNELPLTFLAGTALYSAPEYFLGETGTMRSDVFSLGVITYYLLTGQYPYSTDVAKCKTISAQRNLWYRTALDDEREIPAWVDDAIRKAVHPLPERRYEEIFEFSHDLRHPNQQFLNKTRPPLMDRNPVAVWQGVCFILVGIIVYLLTH